MLKFKFVAAKPVEADPDGPSLLPDYKVYELTLQQRILTLIAGGLLMYGIGYLFYHHWLLSLLLMPGGAYAPIYCVTIY